MIIFQQQKGLPHFQTSTLYISRSHPQIPSLQSLLDPDGPTLPDLPTFSLPSLMPLLFPCLPLPSSGFAAFISITPLCLLSLHCQHLRFELDQIHMGSQGKCGSRKNPNRHAVMGQPHPTRLLMMTSLLCSPHPFSTGRNSPLLRGRAILYPLPPPASISCCILNMIFVSYFPKKREVIEREILWSIDTMYDHLLAFLPTKCPPWMTGKRSAYSLHLYLCYCSDLSQIPQQMIIYSFDWRAALSIHSLVTQSCPTLCSPMDCSLPGSSVHGIHQGRILERVAISFSRGSSWPRDETHISCYPALKVDSLPLSPPGKPHKNML